LTIEITRTSGGTFLYRQREDDPCVIESKPVYRGSPWRFLARFQTPEEARAALLAIGKEGEEEGK
jgi:hypothetical protein